ncbi:hypothetical protein [Arthrobacter sp. zg-Y1110]|uniref:hypothetical protein n=1 Tax=Arthrobacter sp. zg-Y1110 TaxID=2886932 RepID=UPI001D1466F2|nr:hypothetical protein [Arthrobacter sp. zg-Y1110]MCC3292979.1 hypothetical protein [Arthrobacter sp. zg-Y1110]UWX86918.1 hypothetical protein N2K99_18920 [Arthrobacter sp. zg-Y1110]
MTAIIIVLAWFSALGIILPVNAYLAAGRDRADRAADVEVARRADFEELHAAA